MIFSHNLSPFPLDKATSLIAATLFNLVSITVGVIEVAALYLIMYNRFGGRFALDFSGRGHGNGGDEEYDGSDELHVDGEKVECVDIESAGGINRCFVNLRVTLLTVKDLPSLNQRVPVKTDANE